MRYRKSLKNRSRPIFKSTFNRPFRGKLTASFKTLWFLAEWENLFFLCLDFKNQFCIMGVTIKFKKIVSNDFLAECVENIVLSQLIFSLAQVKTDCVYYEGYIKKNI